MNLKRYFASHEGSGALATSNKRGSVDIAVYSTPHVHGRDEVSFVMRPRLSRRNLKSNPRAAYMFVSKEDAGDGIRLYLTMTGEETDQAKVLALRKRTKPLKKGDKLFLVHFRVTKARALIGDKEYPLT